MKRTLSVMLCALIMLGAFGILASAEADSVSVYVTIADQNGGLAIAYEKITVSDTDGDGALTINDALFAAHEAKFEGGASAGYKSYEGAYGLAIEKLWGVDNGGSYGYYLNNASATNLSATVRDGDCVSAFLYTDLTAWSDTFCFFDVNTVSADAGTSVTLTLSSAGYDENWNPVTLPVQDAVITVDGKETDITTDAEGKAVLTLDVAGTYVISATSKDMTLVPPACILTVNAPISESSAEESSGTSTPQTGDMTDVTFFALLAVIALFGAYLGIKNRRFNEN